MSRDIQETYMRAIAASTDNGAMPGRALIDIEEGFDLKGYELFELTARNALFRRVGLVKTEITIDGPYFDVPSLYQRSGGWEAWIMPVFAVPAFGSDEADIVDLIAFADEGRHKGKVWRLVAACDAIGLDAGEHVAGQRVLTVFTNPKNWLMHWIASCRGNWKWLDAAETGPEMFGALVLDPAKVRWRTHRLEEISPLAAASEIRFADSPQLREQVLKEMQLELPKLPRLRVIKGNPGQEQVNNGTTSRAAAAVD